MNNSYYLEGLQFKTNGEYDKAHESFQKAGDHGPSLFQLGKLNFVDNPDYAANCLKRAIELGESKAKVILADLYYGRGINDDEVKQLLKEEAIEGSGDAIYFIIFYRLLTGPELFDTIYKGYLKSQEKDIPFLTKLDTVNIKSHITIGVMNNFLYSYKNLDNRHNNLEKKYQELEQKYNLLKAHLEFSPDGPGYLEAEKHFLNLKNQLS